MMKTTFGSLTRFGLLISAIVIIGSGALALSMIQQIRTGTLENDVQQTMMKPESAAAPMMRTRDTFDGYDTTAVGADYAAGSAPMIAEKSSIMPYPMPASQFRPGTDRAIVKTGYLDLIVDNPRASSEQITQYVNSLNGAVVDTTITADEGTGGSSRATLSLRVPTSSFDGTLKTLRELSQKILRDQVMSDDRTAQKVDLEATLKNLRATEEQLLAIMKQAKTVSDTLEVQQQLTSTRTQIEQLTAQLQNLNTDVEYSTIYVTLISPAAEFPIVGPTEPSLIEEIKIAFRSSLRWYRNAAIGVLRISFILVPILLVGGGLWTLSKMMRSQQ